MCLGRCLSTFLLGMKPFGTFRLFAEPHAIATGFSIPNWQKRNFPIHSYARNTPIDTGA